MKLTLVEMPMLRPAETAAVVVLIKVAVIFSLMVAVGLPAVAVANSADVVAVESNFVAAAVAVIRAVVAVDTPVMVAAVGVNGPTPIPNFKATSTRHSRFHRRKSCISATCQIPRVSKIWK